MPYESPQQFQRFNFSDIAGAAGQGASAGATIGSFFTPAGAAIGGGVGAGVGALAALLGDYFSQDPQEIYDNLMKQYTESPEYKAEQEALAKLKEQTVSGPTAVEQAALDKAIRATTAQSAGMSGALQEHLASRQGVGSSNLAVLLGQKGQGDANNMSAMAGEAAAAETLRKERGTVAYEQATRQAQQMQDRYREWASGQAESRGTAERAATNEGIAMALQGAGSIAGAYDHAKSNQPPEAPSENRGDFIRRHIVPPGGETPAPRIRELPQPFMQFQAENPGFYGNKPKVQGTGNMGNVGGASWEGF